MSAGVPVVASNLPAFLRVLDDGARGPRPFADERPRATWRRTLVRLLRRPGASATG